jgi:hypothetical protein
VAETEVSLDDLPDAGWLRVRAAEPVPPGPVALEIELVRGQGQVQLWGSAGEGYPDGELFVDGEATGRDLVIVATTDPSRVRGP